MKTITAIEIKKNKELARCWSDICKWAEANCKDITFSYSIGYFATLFIYKGKAMINANVNNDMLRIAWKHHYLTKNLDYKMWSDAVNMGIHAGLDMHNPIYLCPDNLTAAHDYYQLLCEQQRAKEEREAAIRRKLEDKAARENYAEFIKNYADLTLTDGTLTIKPLPSVEAFEAEGEAMHHCVFACGYYKKADTLILSARINGKRAETIEVSLKDFSIVQSRGICNQPSEYHQQILALLKEQMYKIQNRTNKKAA